jgi:hypothetical protein
MFGYVIRHEYEAERDRRIRAEAEADAARQQVAQLLKLVGELAERLPPKTPVPGFGVIPGVTPGLPAAGYSAGEIMKIAAVGKRGIRERNAAAREADIRDEREASERDVGQRRATLSPEEQQLLDKQIPR